MRPRKDDARQAGIFLYGDDEEAQAFAGAIVFGYGIDSFIT